MRRCSNPYPHEGGYVEIRQLFEEAENARDRERLLARARADE